MIEILVRRYPSSNPNHLERWLGKEVVSALSRRMTGWYGPPIAMADVPGFVYASGDGDFCGKVLTGIEVSAAELMAEKLKRFARCRRLKIAAAKRQLGAFGSFAALSASIQSGKILPMYFSKPSITPTPTAAPAIDYFLLTGSPVAGSGSSAAPGGSVPTNATTGAFPYRGGPTANTGHFLNATIANTAIGAGNGIGYGSFLLYDRIFSVAKTMNSTATEAVTGTPSRYQNQTFGSDDFCGGNFVFPTVTSSISSTNHNWTVCKYTNQAGTAGQTFPLNNGITGTSTGSMDTTGDWWLKLASGDSGVKALTQMQCSALITSGTIDFVIGHPLGLFNSTAAGFMCTTDGLMTAFNLIKIFDSACLAILGIVQVGTALTVWPEITGCITAVYE